MIAHNLRVLDWFIIEDVDWFVIQTDKKEIIFGNETESLQMLFL